MLDVLRLVTLFRTLKYFEDDIARELARILIGALLLTFGFSAYI